MYKKFPQQNYIYPGEKPEMNLGDSSLLSESFNESGGENIKESNDDIKISEKYFEIPKESHIPSIQIPFNNIDLFNKNNQGLYFCSITKDTDAGCVRLNSNNKEDNFSIKKKINFDKENNRYSNINSLYKNNEYFFNSLQNDNDSEEEEIVNNEISVNFTENIFIHDANNYKYNKQKEIILNNNICKIYKNDEDIDINNNNLNKKIINKIKNKNLDKRNKINENIQKIIQNINKNKIKWNQQNEKINIKINKDNNEAQNSIENKENLMINGQYNNNNINLNYNDNNKKEKLIKINKNNINNDNCQNLNNKYFESKNTQNIFENNLSKSKISKNISLKRKRLRQTLNTTKKYKIFHKFLTISLDTSGLCTLEDDMNTLLLNPKITYNYPNNNLEKELE